MTEHKHAAVFLAAARGEADEWEVQSKTLERHWHSASDRLEILYECPDAWHVRRKQKTHMVNGFTVPEPLRDSLPNGKEYFVEDSENRAFYYQQWWSENEQHLFRVNRGLAHAAKEGAIANCKARLGIDPNKDE